MEQGIRLICGDVVVRHRPVFLELFEVFRLVPEQQVGASNVLIHLGPQNLKAVSFWQP